MLGHPPGGDAEDQIMIKGYVPMDDTHTMVWTIMRTAQQKQRARTKSGEAIPGLGFMPNAKNEYKPHTTDWFGRWRLAAQRCRQ